tara:strand:- start:8611 stop:9486 length:876 start_codon:yes stop_codon:yes gene_type:complete
MKTPLKDPKDTVFSTISTLNCGGNLVDLSTPKVMGIVNITPDSFFTNSRATNEKELLLQVEKHLTEGASFIDLGAMSTRPGSTEISQKEEENRLLPALKSVINEFPEAIISVDTYRSQIAKKAIDTGAHLINDISGGQFDEDMFKVIAELNVPYIMMHTLDKPYLMQNNPQYNDVISEIMHFLSLQLNKLRQLGVKDVVLDPGFGFGKTMEHNYTILKHFNEFNQLHCPLLAGVSRKGMIWKLLHSSAEEALNGTSVAHTLALQNGAKILRVHDVRPAMEAIKIVDFYQKQ